MATLPRLLDDAAHASADPRAVRLVFERLGELHGPGRLESIDGPLAARLAAVAGASRSLGRLLGAEPAALEVLAGSPGGLTEVAAARDEADLARRKQLAYLEIAAADLSGRLALEEVGASLSRLADDVFHAACRLVLGERAEGFAVVAMGKLGAEELNYASDVDVMFVVGPDVEIRSADAAARRVLSVASGVYRVDADLRPEGRNGALVRTLASYEAYWQRWARPWEFQALLKTRASAGDAALGARFERAAAEALWAQSFDAEALSELRAMKGRAEELVARRGLSERELKRGRGGIRDVEFAIQLLQLVHGRADPGLRVPATLAALSELAGAGYVDGGDASVLGLAYRFLRTVEHRLQLVDEAQVHTVPPAGPAHDHLARVLGLAPTGEAGPRPRTDRLEIVLSRYQSSARSIHERLFFRPLLEVFAGSGETRLSQAAAAERLAAFGFHDAERTRQALAELTRGLTRSSRLMQQLLPVLLGWLSETPDPDLGLLGLRNLAGLAHQRDVVVAAFRDSPELARRLCVVLGTSRRLGELTRRHPAVALRIGDDAELSAQARSELVERALVAVDGSVGDPASSLRRFVGSETLRIAAADLLVDAPAGAVSRQLSDLGDATVTAALHSCSPRLPFAVVAMGRLGGTELSYGSDLDLLLVYDGEGPSDAVEAERVATSLARLMNGPTPAERIWTVDTSLRPEGRQGPLARSLEAYRTYYERWVAAWERQALLRARPLAGDRELLERFMSVATTAVFGPDFGESDVREIRRLKARTERERIPAGEDPQFHLKLGKGSLADVEWTVQLLELEHGLRAANTLEAVTGLYERGILDPGEASVLTEAHAFLTSTRSRWHLVGNYVAGAGGPVTALGSDSLPHSHDPLGRLARSLGLSPAALRERYRRVTRRARRVVERRFYGL